ncbi:MAG: biotin-dependent carboxyltransferase family protein [Planctomycetaceae bacterium]|nr:biotin-dependent carboxyltransferase family protein [Planctomycetaceae bacterium]
MNRLHIIRAGLCSTVQDLGRMGNQHLGVPVGGAMDRMSHELANLLIGNAASAATIEMTLTGDEIEFIEDSLIAVTGADMAPVLCQADTEPRSIPQHCPVKIPSGARVRFQAAQRGCRSYLAIAGGVDVPLLMGSRATDLRSAFGGHHGRMLRAGDQLAVGALSEFTPGIFDQLSISGQAPRSRWFVRPVDLPSLGCTSLRIVQGTHTSLLKLSQRERLSEIVFRVSAQSDRMGYRLSDHRLILQRHPEIFSAGAGPGTIQLPPDGNPILLMADCAPTGGYPRIGHVISADLPIAAQLRPGQLIRFEMVPLERAQELFLQQRQNLAKALAMAKLMPPQAIT